MFAIRSSDEGVLLTRNFPSSFTDSGHGCRHWCATALSRLADAGFVDQDISDIFVAYEEREVRKLGDKFPMPRITGTFYD